MIEQTPLVVKEWIYLTPGENEVTDGNIRNETTLQVMKKRAADKKGIACRFTSRFTSGNKVFLQYAAEDSYVIDLADVIDRKELITMLNNSFSKFESEFNKRKFTTAFINHHLAPFDANFYDLEPILPLLRN